MNGTEMVHHLYIHLPFCPHICPYCSFHVLRVEKEGMGRLLDGLIAEYRGIARELALDTIFLGGGTPTALSSGQLDQLLGVFTCEPSVEFSCECNPSTLSSGKAAVLRSHGVNRLSIGAQSFDPGVLRTLGRTHSVEAISRCVETARSADFSNINLDLIFGVPGQTLQSWEATLRHALSLQPQHLSCYGLTYEEDTEFFARRGRGDLETDPALEEAMYNLAEEALTAAGLVHYEISNYARPGFECRHNLTYWRGEDYYGIGPSAVSTVRGVRWTNSRLRDGRWRREVEELLPTATRASERMALGLRTGEGVEETRFSEKFGFRPRDRWVKEIDLLISNGLLQEKPPLRLSARGRRLADEVAVYFV